MPPPQPVGMPFGTLLVNETDEGGFGQGFQQGFFPSAEWQGGGPGMGMNYPPPPPPPPPAMMMGYPPQGGGPMMGHHPQQGPHGLKRQRDG